jgi:hypothetical protein
MAATLRDDGKSEPAKDGDNFAAGSLRSLGISRFDFDRDHERRPILEPKLCGIAILPDWAISWTKPVPYCNELLFVFRMPFADRPIIAA